MTQGRWKNIPTAYGYRNGEHRHATISQAYAQACCSPKAGPGTADTHSSSPNSRYRGGTQLSRPANRCSWAWFVYRAK
jgi:hypothetical protein